MLRLAMSSAFTFANGLRLFESDLLQAQLERYRQLAVPLHEPVEEAWFECLLGETPPGRFVFLDIGAALGYYSILVRRRRPDARAIAVDPNPEFHARFAATLALNGFAPDEVELLRKAVAPRAGRVAFMLNNYGAHLAPDAVLPGPPRRRFWPFGRTLQAVAPGIVAVEALSLDGLLAWTGEEVDLAKLDIQGFELAVLEASARLARGLGPRAWIVGTHGAEVHAGVRDLLGRNHEILFEDLAPPEQPDGIVVARRRA